MSGWEDLYNVLTVRPLSSPMAGGDLRSPFSAKWSDTVNLLAREIRHLRPRSAILEAGFLDYQLRLDGFPKATARPWSEAVILTLVGTPHGDLRYPRPTFATWQENVRAIALALESLRRVDRYGVTKRGEQYAGWKAITAGGPDADRGRQIIAKHGSVVAALKATHPDHGGDAHDFADVQAART